MPRPGFAPFRELERLAECESGSSRFGRCHSGLRQDLKHLIGGAAQARAFGRHHDGALDQNGVRNHEIDKLVIGPLRIAKAEFLVRRALLSQQSRGPMPIAASSSFRRSRLGGVLRYSIISGSVPLWRIKASVLRDVPQAGL